MDVASPNMYRKGERKSLSRARFPRASFVAKGGRAVQFIGRATCVSCAGRARDPTSTMVVCIFRGKPHISSFQIVQLFPRHKQKIGPFALFWGEVC